MTRAFLPVRISSYMPRIRKTGRERIVSLAPSVTSIVVALGARDQLVGVTKWCKDVADVRGLPMLGDCWSGDASAVLREKPTLIIGSVPYKIETVAELLKAPATFVATNPRSLSDVYRDIRQIGGLVGRTAAAEKLISRMQHTFKALSVRARRARIRPRVYSEAWPNPRISSPPWVAELIEIAGGRMVVPPGQQVSDEMVARANPDVIVLAWAATGARAKPKQAFDNPAWKDVEAIRNRRVHVVRDELLNTPGPPLLEGVRELFRLLHSSGTNLGAESARRARKPRR